MKKILFLTLSIGFLSGAYAQSINPETGDQGDKPVRPKRIADTGNQGDKPVDPRRIADTGNQMDKPAGPKRLPETRDQGDKPIGPKSPACNWYQLCYWFD